MNFLFTALQATTEIVSPVTDRTLVWQIFSIITGSASVISLCYIFINKKRDALVNELARKDLEDRKAQGLLGAKQAELEEKEKYKTLLQNQISNELPREAVKIIIKEKLEYSVDNLRKYYEDVKQCVERLEGLGNDTKVEKDLLRMVEREIQPKYYLKNRIVIYQSILTVCVALLAIGIPFIYFKPVVYATIVVGTVIILSLFQIIRLSITRKSKDSSRTREIFKKSFLILALIGMFAIWLIMAIYTVYSFGKSTFDFVTGLIFTLIIPVGMGYVIWNFKTITAVKQRNTSERH